MPYLQTIQARQTEKQDPALHHRRSIRLRGYDYAQVGAYFVTLCTQQRACLFGNILDGQMQLNEAGELVANQWLMTAQIRQEIELDAWVVMPNHLHGIVVINSVGAHGRAPLQSSSNRQGLYRPPKTLGSLVAGFKSVVAKGINELRQTPGAKLWQRNYWEHIIRNETELNRIRDYILDNPARWESDSLFVSPASDPQGFSRP